MSIIIAQCHYLQPLTKSYKAYFLMIFFIMIVVTVEGHPNHTSIYFFLVSFNSFINNLGNFVRHVSVRMVKRSLSKVKTRRNIRQFAY